MIIAIVRHGKAERDSASGSDADRVLQPRGHRQAAYLAGELAGRLRGPPILLASPYARARQTAEPLAPALQTALQFDERLESGQPASCAIEVIAQHGSPRGCLVLVGHNPQLSDLVSLLTRGPVPQGDEWLRTGEAVVCRLDDWVQPVGAGVAIERLRLPEY